MYYVYVLKSLSTRKSYVGVTDSIDRRLKEHNSGKMAYTRRFKPWEVIHLEPYDSLGEAKKRELSLKSGSGRRFLRTLFENIK